MREVERRRVLAAGLGLPLLAACSQQEDQSDSASPATSSSTASVDSAKPLGWGPTAGELQAAQELVAGWNEKRLAGQVIVGRYHGTTPQAAGDLVRKLHLAGICMTTSNIADAAQIRATTKAIEQAVKADGRDFPAVIGVDQEGGVVSHLRGIATTFPPFADAGKAISRNASQGTKVVQEASAAMGQEAATYGYTWIFAPVADVTIGSADPIIGSRSASSDPETASRATVAAVKGFNSVGIVSTIKHFPGHGSVTTDSHKGLPTQSASLQQLKDRDLKPFGAAIKAGAPAVMLSHINVTAIAPGGPASEMPAMYRFLREQMGFQGVAITDSLGMGAVAGKHDPGVNALAAGADLILMPVNPAATHAKILAAVKAGTIKPERLKEAASRVVALQRWQARQAVEATPDAARSRAQKAAAALTSG